jgi:hypothetical protein
MQHLVLLETVGEQIEERSVLGSSVVCHPHQSSGEGRS